MRLCDVDVGVVAVVPVDDWATVVVVATPGNNTGSYKIGSDSSSNCRKRSNSANHKSRAVVAVVLVADDVVAVVIRSVLPWPLASSSSST